MQVSNEGSKAKIAERKSAFVPKSPSFISSNFTEWDPEQATKLIQESARLHPPAVVIFVRPAPKFTPKFDVRRRDNKPQGPHSHNYFNDGGGGSDRGSYFIPQLQNLSTQKNPSAFLHQQILLFIFWKAKTCRDL